MFVDHYRWTSLSYSSRCIAYKNCDFLYWNISVFAATTLWWWVQAPPILPKERVESCRTDVASSMTVWIIWEWNSKPKWDHLTSSNTKTTILGSTNSIADTTASTAASTNNSSKKHQLAKMAERALFCLGTRYNAFFEDEQCHELLTEINTNRRQEPTGRTTNNIAQLVMHNQINNTPRSLSAIRQSLASSILEGCKQVKTICFEPNFTFEYHKDGIFLHIDNDNRGEGKLYLVGRNNNLEYQWVTLINRHRRDQNRTATTETGNNKMRIKLKTAKNMHSRYITSMYSYNVFHLYTGFLKINNRCTSYKRCMVKLALGEEECVRKSGKNLIHTTTEKKGCSVIGNIGLNKNLRYWYAFPWRKPKFLGYCWRKFEDSTFLTAHSAHIGALNMCISNGHGNDPVELAWSLNAIDFQYKEVSITFHHVDRAS